MSIYDEVKAEMGVGPDFPTRKQFTTVHGYSHGRSLGEFSTVEEARAAGATATENVCDEEAYSAARTVYFDHQQAVHTEWRRRVRAMHPEVNDAVYHLVYDKAYDDGHSGGMGEVETYLDDYVEWATRVIAAAAPDSTTLQ